MRPSARIDLFNGPIETKFIKFELYAGSKKDQYDRKSAGKKDYRKDNNGKKRFGDRSVKPQGRRDDRSGGKRDNRTGDRRDDRNKRFRKKD